MRLKSAYFFDEKKVGTMKRLAIVGSRTRNSEKDKQIVKEEILRLNPDEIVSGGCKKGADNFAEFWGNYFGIPLKIFLPNIKPGMTYYEMVKEYYKRNKQIAVYGTDMLALPSKDRTGGTENAIKYFKSSHKNWREKLILR